SRAGAPSRGRRRFVACRAGRSRAARARPPLPRAHPADRRGDRRPADGDSSAPNVAAVALPTTRPHVQRMVSILLLSKRLVTLAKGVVRERKAHVLVCQLVQVEIFAAQNCLDRYVLRDPADLAQMINGSFTGEQLQPGTQLPAPRNVKGS